MVYETLPLLKSPDLAQMTELADDLVRLAYRFGSAVVHASLRCLARSVLVGCLVSLFFFPAMGASVAGGVALRASLR